MVARMGSVADCTFQRAGSATIDGCSSVRICTNLRCAWHICASELNGSALLKPPLRPRPGILTVTVRN